LAHHVKRTLLNRAVLVDADVDCRDGLVFHVGLHMCDQVLRAELRRWNRTGFAMHPSDTPRSPDLNIRAGDHRIALIGDDARERPRRRGLGRQLTWRTDRQNSQE